MSRKIIVDVGRSRQISFKTEFDEVWIDGKITTATLHNPTFINNLGIGIGAKAMIYKANMIIPAVDEIITIPDVLYQFDYKCPYCGEEVTHRTNSDGSKSENVFCENKDCSRVKMKKIAHFASKKGRWNRCNSASSICTTNL